jgi:hypothetical protein
MALDALRTTEGTENPCLRDRLAAFTDSKSARSSTGRTGPARCSISLATCRSKAVLSVIAEILSESFQQPLDATAGARRADARCQGQFVGVEARHVAHGEQRRVVGIEP